MKPNYISLAIVNITFGALITAAVFLAGLITYHQTDPGIKVPATQRLHFEEI